MTNSLDAWARDRLAVLEGRDRLRRLTTAARHDDARIRTADGEFISFACNDYLALSRHPEVVAACMEATLRHGAGSGASRLITGNNPQYAQLEQRLAAFKGTEDAVVFGSGYLANLGIMRALAGNRDLILLDELAHSCRINGAKLAGSTTLKFRHNDVDHCEELLESNRRDFRNVLIATEGVFSMDGDRAPLPRLVDLCTAYDAWLLCDDAHGMGVLGRGRGCVAEANVAGHVPLQMGTLSKALGAYGGFLCASATVCEFIRNRAQTFIYSTGLPPGVVAAADKALEIIERDAQLVARPLARARQFTKAIGNRQADSAVVPLIFGESSEAADASAQLAERGFFVPAIRPPTVPQGTARLRFAFSAAHSSDDVAALAAAVTGLLQNHGARR